MQPRFVDMHTHTTASDGSDTPTELVRKAADCGLAALAITDHDTVSGLDEAVEAGQQLGLEVIRGCELSVSSRYGEVHILGLWLPKDCTTLDSELVSIRAMRDERNSRILERLQRVGVPLTQADVLAESRGETVGRPHIARALLRHGHVATMQEAFFRFLAKGGSAYEPKDVLSPQEGVSLLADLGATVSIAHPMLIRCPREWLDSTVAELVPMGLSAIEAYHSQHSAGDERYCADLAGRYGLAVTGGSDYHGTAKPHISLGRGRGGLRVTEAVLDRLKTRRLSRGVPV